MSRTDREFDVPGRVLLTGASGYIGGRIACVMVEKGWTVHSTIRRSSSPLPEGVHGHLVDERYASVRAAVQAAAPDLVVHIASQVKVTHTPDDVAPMVSANVTFPTLLLEAMRETGVRRLIDTGTSWQHHDPGSLYEPTNLYAATKEAFHDLCAYYVAAEDFTIVQLKLFDVYGPADGRGKIVPLLLKLLHSRVSLAMTGGMQRMDMIHVDDVASAYIAAIDRIGSGQAVGLESFAVRSGTVLGLREIVAEFERQAGESLAIEWGGRPYREREVMEPWFGTNTLPGWQPQVDLARGLRQVIDAARAAVGAE